MNDSIKLLIAEDDPDEHAFIKSAFKKYPFFEIVDIVSNGKELVEKLECSVEDMLPDLILSDLNMPMVDGLTALTKLKSNPMLCKIPFVIFTTCGQETTKKLCHSKGADGFLVKPWTLNNYDKFILSLKSIYDRFTEIKL